MRQRAKVDSNQKEIVAEFRRLGCSVLHLHTVGKGCPDICVGYQGKNYLIEVKDGSLPPSKRQLTADEKEFFEGWRGQVIVVGNIKQVQELISSEK